MAYPLLLNHILDLLYSRILIIVGKIVQDAQGCDLPPQSCCELREPITDGDADRLVLAWLRFGVCDCDVNIGGEVASLPVWGEVGVHVKGVLVNIKFMADKT